MAEGEGQEGVQPAPQATEACGQFAYTETGKTASDGSEACRVCGQGFDAHYSETAMRRTLYRKLLEAQRSAPAVTKDGTTEEQGKWKYASHENVLNTLVPVLLAQGLVLTRSLVRTEDFETKTSGDKPKVQWMHSATYEYTLTDAETGYAVSFQAEGRSLNTDDRGAVHAIANAEKPFLMGLLMVATEEDKKEPQTVTRSRQTKAPAQNRGNAQPAQPRPTNPVGVQHHSGPRRIPDADGFKFKREGDEWIQSPGGYLLPSCKKHEGGAPMMELPPNGQRYLCVVDGCGEYLDLRDQPLPAAGPAPAAPAGPSSAPAAATAPPRIFPTEVLRQEVERIAKARRLYPWQWDSIFHAALLRGFPDDLKVWGEKDWTAILDAMRKDLPGLLRASLEACAKDTPAADYRVRHLRELAVTQKGLPMAKRAEVEEVIKAPQWHDAVEELIDQLETGRQQGELQIGAVAS